MDAILQVVTPAGIVLAENHDDVGLDPRLAYIAQESGTHLVRLFAFPSEPNSQIEFAGGDDYVYRLTLTTGPYITHAANLSVCADEPGEVAVCGWNIPRQTRLPVVPFGGAKCGSHGELEHEAPTEVQVSASDRCGLAFSQGYAGVARIRLVPHDVARPCAKADSSDPMSLAPPIAVTGCIGAPGEAEAFHVRLQKDQQVVIAVESLGLYSPLVPAVRLVDPSGKVAAQTRESGPAQDVELTHTSPEDGEYVLTVSDRFGHGGARYAYRLTVRDAEADFALTTETDAFVVKPGAENPTELKVKLDRRSGPEGSVGPIMVEAVELPPGVTAEAVVSQPEGPTAEEVTLKFMSKGEAFSGPIRLRGTAAVPHVIQRFAHTPPKLGATFESIWLTAVAGP
jgi:hypothetical protein